MGEGNSGRPHSGNLKLTLLMYNILHLQNIIDGEKSGLLERGVDRGFPMSHVDYKK